MASIESVAEQSRPEVASPSPSAPIVIGLDDGYSDTKVALPGGRLVSIPSSARRGSANRTWLNGRAPTISEYVTDSEPWSAGDLQHESTQFAEYPQSALNRVIVQHALQAAGLAGNVIELASGLPVSVFYDSQGTRRTKRIEAKSANLSVPVGPADDRAPATIGFNSVIPEALAAWYDFVISESKGDVQMDAKRVNSATAIIDIGGRTTDFVVVADQSIDHARSGSISCGLLNIEQAIADALIDKHQLDGLTRAQIQSAILTGRLRLFGKEHELGDMATDATTAVIGLIRDECQRKLGTAAELDHVVFAGGGAMALDTQLRGWFPHQVTAPAAGFANARGMLKFMSHVAERPNSSVVTAAQ